MNSNNSIGNGPDDDSHRQDDDRLGFDYTEQDTSPTDDITLAQKFEEFHRDNPNVYATLVMLARRWVISTGKRKLGARILWERLRWELAISTFDNSDYKLNNDYIAFYARLLMIQEPDLANLFNLRRSAADTWIAGRAA